MLYGTRTPVKGYFVAELRTADGGSRAETFISTSRATAFRAFVGLAKGDKIVAVREINEQDTDEMERWGFRPQTVRPSRLIRWSELDLY